MFRNAICFNSKNAYITLGEAALFWGYFGSLIKVTWDFTDVIDDLHALSYALQSPGVGEAGLISENNRLFVEVAGKVKVSDLGLEPRTPVLSGLCSSQLS